MGKLSYVYMYEVSVVLTLKYQSFLPPLSISLGPLLLLTGMFGLIDLGSGFFDQSLGGRSFLGAVVFDAVVYASVLWLISYMTRYLASVLVDLEVNYRCASIV